MTDQSKIDAGWDDLLGEDNQAEDDASPRPIAPQVPSAKAVPATASKPLLPPPPAVAQPPRTRPPVPALKVPSLARRAAPAATPLEVPEALDALPPPPEFATPASSAEVPLEVGSDLDDDAPVRAHARAVSDVSAAAVAQDLDLEIAEDEGPPPFRIPGEDDDDSDDHIESVAKNDEEPEFDIPDDDDDEAVELEAAEEDDTGAAEPDEELQPEESGISQVEVAPQLARPAVEIDRRPNTGPVAAVSSADSTKAAAPPKEPPAASGGVPMGWIAAGIAAVAIIGLGVWMMGGDDDESSPTTAQTQAKAPSEQEPEAVAAEGGSADAVAANADSGGSTAAASDSATDLGTSGGGTAGATGQAATEGSGGTGGTQGSDDGTGSDTSEAESDSTGNGDTEGETDDGVAAAEEAPEAPPSDAVAPTDPDHAAVVAHYDAAAARYATSEDPEDLVTMAITACDLDEGPNARDAFRKLKGRDLRSRALIHCREKGVDVLANIDGYTGPELISRAQHAMDSGDAKSALSLARAANKVERSSKAMTIATVAACTLGEAETAQDILRHVSKKGRAAAIEQCTALGVTLKE